MPDGMIESGFRIHREEALDKAPVINLLDPLDRLFPPSGGRETVVAPVMGKIGRTDYRDSSSQALRGSFDRFAQFDRISRRRGTERERLGFRKEILYKWELDLNGIIGGAVLPQMNLR